MLTPIEWLKEYVDIHLSDKDLAAKLTASGSSVERSYVIGLGLDDLIVAEVLEVAKHPNADRLRVAQVNTGHEVLEVVCGAPNLEAGQHIVFARDGAQVPVDMHDPERKSFTLTEATIRDVVSHGMICSMAELGLGEEHGGIMVLPETSVIGQPIAKALGLPQTVFDIEITSNRSDELSMVGLAREVSVLTGNALKTPEIKPTTVESPGQFNLEVKTESCLRLAAQVLDITVGPSPWWLQQRLMLSGMRSINNVVDITNYVMLEYGQPLHAYDLSQLDGNLLQVRMADHNEIVTTLDGVERTLTSNMMVIADAKKALSVAGIMGGKSSMIAESSKTIVLEAAVFDPIPVRKTANALALRSEASKRFERGVDPENTLKALNRAVELLVELAQAKPQSMVIDSYPHQPVAKTITLSQRKLNQYMGKEFPLDHGQKILQALGFQPQTGVANNSLSVNVPSWRIRDVDGEADLIEEIVRMVGYEQLPVQLPSGQLTGQTINQSYTNRIKAKRLLANAGWMEILTNSLTNLTEVNQQSSLRLANPLSSEWTHLRQTLFYGLLETASRNSRMGDLELFELSSVYLPNKTNLPLENWHLGLIKTNKLSAEHNLMDTKAAIEAVLHSLGIDATSINYQSASTVLTGLDKRNTAAIVLNKKTVGYIGKLDHKTAEQSDLSDSTIVAELDVTDLLANSHEVTFKPLAKFPSVEEDISLLLAEDQELGSIIEAAIKAADGLVESISVGTTYRNASLGEGKKSPLLHIVYRKTDGTLSAEEMAAIRQKVVGAIEEKGVSIRV